MGDGLRKRRHGMVRQLWPELVPLGHPLSATAYTFHRSQPPNQRNPRKADLVLPPILKWREP